VCSGTSSHTAALCLRSCSSSACVSHEGGRSETTGTANGFGCWSRCSHSQREQASSSSPGTRLRFGLASRGRSAKPVKRDERRAATDQCDRSASRQPNYRVRACSMPATTGPALRVTARESKPAASVVARASTTSEHSHALRVWEEAKLRARCVLEAVATAKPSAGTLANDRTSGAARSKHIGTHS
jgi:hypothetical protein